MFVKDKISYFFFFASLKIFSYNSGLHVNDEKTELFADRLSETGERRIPT